MTVTCGACGNAIEVEGQLSNGQHVVCPVCGEQTQFDMPTRIEIPVGAVRHAEQAVAPEEDNAAEEIVSEEKPKLRIIRNSNQGDESVNPVDRRKISMTEERLKMYEDLKHKAWRRKFLTNLFSVIVLLALPIVGWFIYSEWVAHTKMIEHEAELKAAEERARAEREEIERRERDEKERQEREARRAEELAAQQHARELAQEEQARLENQRKVMAEQYRVFSVALSENEFDMFNKNVTNGLEKVGGELCYCFPSDGSTIPFYWVTYSTNGVDSIREIMPSGAAVSIDLALLESKMNNQDYVVARESKVYFHSRKKNNRMGVLPKDRQFDPAEVFFGKMSGTLERLKASYDELTFDIVFVPARTKKQIVCENVEFGCSYSIDNVREALGKAFPPSRTLVSSSSNIKKFNRTVKLWNGSDIKTGLDGITYVPRTCPSTRDRPSNSYYDINGRVIWRRRSQGVNYKSYDRWNALYNQAIQEDRAEAEYYENERRRRNNVVANSRLSDEREWISKIDKIFSEGTLYYRIKKAKRNN